MSNFFTAAFLFLTLVSCNKAELLKHGKVTLHNTADKNSFIFSVDEEFSRRTAGAMPDKKNPKLNKAEAKLLSMLLEEKQYCTKGFGAPKFTITSSQEKIYDATFANLIQQNYNAKAVAPKMFFGQCVNEK